MPKVLMQDRQLEVDLLGESVIVQDGWYPEALRRFDDGRMVVRANYWKRNWDAPGRDPWCMVSGDGGQTWQPCAKSGDGLDYALAADPFLSQRRDGSVIGWASSWISGPEYKGRPGQPIPHTMVRAPSWEALLRGQGQTAPATLWLPHSVPLVGDDFRTVYTAAIWGKMVETETGHLIQGAYPVLEYDRAPRLWAEQKGPAAQYRTCVLYSQDDGATWHYLATVASSDRYPLPAQGEGYCEPDLLYFGDGRLLCVMRSGGSPSGKLMERCTPLVACRSEDGGLSWTAPTPIAAYGVKPVLTRMSSGPVACLAGRPGFFLAFSADQGRTWSTPCWVTESHGRWSRSASGYGEVIELEPGVLGVAYDEYCGDESSGRMVTKFRRYRVKG
jgi:hypothetical protein